MTYSSHVSPTLTCPPTRDGPYDVLAGADDGSGLKVPSRVQFDKIATLAKTVISGRIGSMPAEFMAMHKPLLLRVLGLECS